MAYICDFVVCVYAEDWDEEEGWTGNNELVKEFTFDTYGKACEFVRNITPEKAVEWEDEWNGLDILIYKECYEDSIYGLRHCDSTMLGESEWIGDKKNGDWL